MGANFILGLLLFAGEPLPPPPAVADGADMFRPETRERRFGLLIEACDAGERLQ